MGRHSIVRLQTWQACRRRFGWISRCLWNLRSWKERTWFACRSIGASASTESHKASLSISLRNKVFTREYCSPLRGMYRDLRRRFVMAGHVGSEFAASNGVIQGCPLSVLLLNLLMKTWARAVEAQTATATPKVYADDAGVLSQNSCGHRHCAKNHWSFRHCHSAKTERGQNQGLGHH